MYELGIRHALNLPVVIMGWKGQRLPFDISNQRAILEERDFESIPRNIELLESFISEAKDGSFYKPMDVVIRSGILERASDELASDNLLRVIADEIRDLKDKVERKHIGRLPSGIRKRHIVRGYLGSKQDRKLLHQKYLEKGGNPEAWGKILGTPIDDELYEKTIGWSVTQWREYVLSQIVPDTDENNF